MTLFTCHRYLLMTTDPVHIGTGGYRLGRVDNSIVREPGTRIPKIPGTSLHGAARSYAARIYEDPHSAGQSHKKAQHIATNPVCYTFGYLQETGDDEKTQNQGAKKETKGYSGTVNMSDASVLFFPVHSMYGPVWVSTVLRLEDAGFSELPQSETLGYDEIVCTWDRKEQLNLGWLMLNVHQTKVQITPPGTWAQDEKRWTTIKDRIVIVRPDLFSHIINSNLEVRTSVSINPERGAAEEGQLFTYEALPRATFLSMDVVIDDYRGDFQRTDKTAKGNQIQGQKTSWDNPADVVDAGLHLIEWLGVGGMGTRGFGRVAIVGKWDVQ
jgi:CRISPR-associated protein Cmr4